MSGIVQYLGVLTVVTLLVDMAFGALIGLSGISAKFTVLHFLDNNPLPAPLPFDRRHS